VDPGVVLRAVRPSHALEQLRAEPGAESVDHGSMVPRLQPSYGPSG
jgi:hypothetical protein